MLSLNDLTFAYADNTQPFRFTMNAEPGTITLITGPSGSGKSTLFDLIAGFQVPRAGTLTFNGSSLLQQTADQRPVSILFQADNLFDHLSVRQNLAFAYARSSDRKGAEPELLRAMDEVRLDRNLMTRRASELSGGQKQRVALARTLLRDKPIMLLDEPFSALDSETKTGLRDLLRQLTKRRNLTTLVISHDPADRENLADRTYRIMDRMLELEE